MTLYSIGYLARLHGVSTSTIRRWEAKGLVAKSIRTLGGHRRYDIEDNPQEPQTSAEVVGYARVSSHDQKSDLERQKEVLREAGCDSVISDIGSGLNCSKPGLRQLLRRLLDGKVKTLVMTHEDRLLRFGSGLVRFICARMGTEFRVLRDAETLSFESEPARDVITLMTVFCARLYARRARKRKKSKKHSPL